MKSLRLIRTTIAGALLLACGGYIGWMMRPTVKESLKVQTLPSVTEIQQTLVAAGYDIGPKGVDGRLGGDTKLAWESYLADEEQKEWNQYAAECMTETGAPK